MGLGSDGAATEDIANGSSGSSKARNARKAVGKPQNHDAEEPGPVGQKRGKPVGDKPSEQLPKASPYINAREGELAGVHDHTSQNGTIRERAMADPTTVQKPE